MVFLAPKGSLPLAKPARTVLRWSPLAVAPYIFLSGTPFGAMFSGKWKSMTCLPARVIVSEELRGRGK